MSQKSKNATIIENKVLNCPTVSWADVQNFEANRLKAAEKRNTEKLKTSILREGFCFPIFVWQPEGGHTPYIIDGAGRMEALRQLQKAGHTIGDIPVAYISAESKEAAKKLVTLASSQFGLVSSDSFADFVQDIGGMAAVMPDVAISSTIFATDYVGPVVGPEEDAPKKREQGARMALPEFEPMDILEIGPHSLTVGYEDKPILAKILRFIRKEWPDIELQRNGEPL